MSTAEQSAERPSVDDPDEEVWVLHWREIGRQLGVWFTWSVLLSLTPYLTALALTSSSTPTWERLTGQGQMTLTALALTAAAIRELWKARHQPYLDDDLVLIGVGLGTFFVAATGTVYGLWKGQTFERSSRTVRADVVDTYIKLPLSQVEMTTVGSALSLGMALIFAGAVVTFSAPRRKV